MRAFLVPKIVIFFYSEIMNVDTFRNRHLNLFADTGVKFFSHCACAQNVFSEPYDDNIIFDLFL